MRYVFVMDPLDRVHPDKDTSYGFIAAAMGRGHQCHHALIHDVERVAGQICARARPLRLNGRELAFAGESIRLGLSDVDAIFIRKDPPFDQAYAYATQLLELIRGKTLIVNDPRGLREANEKLYALNFSSWMPPTIVTADRDAIHGFVADVGGKAVIKPLDGAGGYGVLAVRNDDSNARGIVDLLTDEGKQLAMVQAFLPAVREGDKRVLLLDGELLGAILRVPAEGDLRANIHVGGSVIPTELSPREQQLVAAVGPRLSADGLVFVGLDLIGQHLTEVNVTSPTGIRELSTFTGKRQSDTVIEWVERRVGG